MDEHHLEVRREGRNSILPIPSAGQGLCHHLFVRHALGHLLRCLDPVGATFEGPSQLLELRILLGRRMAYVCPHGPLYISADQPLAHQVGDWPHGSEPLNPEIIGEAFVGSDDLRIALDDLLDFAHVGCAVPDRYPERIADEVAQLYGSRAAIDIGDLHILQRDFSEIFGGAPERHQLRCDRTLVLGPGESYAGPGHPQAARHDADKAVGLPVAAPHPGDGIFSIIFRSWGVGYLIDHEVLWKCLEMPSGAISVAEVPAHADIGLGCTAFSVQKNHSLNVK